MRRIMILLAVVMMSGCVASYHHLDPTPLHNDNKAYDMFCGGLEKQVYVLRLRGDICKATNGEDFFHGTIEYRFGRDT